MISNEKTTLAPLGLLLISFALLININMASAEVTNKSNIKATYNESCAICHEKGVLNAPKANDKEVWRQLKYEKGVPQLIESVKNGLSQMPAGGLCRDCSDADYEALIDLMSE